MKSFSTTSFVAALALAPSAFAVNTFWTFRTYSDSSCTYLTNLYTLIASGGCDGLATTSCQVQGDGSSYETSCGSSLLGEIGNNSYVIYYEDTDCVTVYSVISMACAWCTGNQLYPTDPFHSALAPFLCFRCLPIWATILARPHRRRPLRNPTALRGGFSPNTYASTPTAVRAKWIELSTQPRSATAA